MAGEEGGDKPPENMQVDNTAAAVSNKQAINHQLKRNSDGLHSSNIDPGLTLNDVSNSGDNINSPNAQNNGFLGKSKFIDLNNKYNPNDTGPYSVYVEHQDKNFGRLFPIRIGHYLRISDTYRRSILDIKSVGINRVKVILDNFKAANGLINNPLLSSNGFIAYIPRFYTQRKGIIRQVDTFFDIDYLFREIESDRKVLEVKRMQKRVEDKNNRGQTVLVDRQMVILSFVGSTLPNHVKINGVIFPVEPYIYPVVQCMHCMRYGHISKQCKDALPTCKKCNDSHKSDECSSDFLYCKHCKSTQHGSTSKECSVYKKQKRIKEIMSLKNVSFKEAENIEKNPSYSKVLSENRFQILSDLTEFPSLPNKAKNENGRKTLQHMTHNTRSPNLERRATKSITHTDTSQYRGSHTQNLRTSAQAQNKKRRASLSPQRESKASTASSVLPNPYRHEFADYKEKLADQLTIFIDKIVSQLVSQNEAAGINVEQLKIKENVSTLIAHITGDFEDDDDVDDTY